VNDLYKKVEIFNSKGENITPLITYLDNLIIWGEYPRAYNFLNRKEVRKILGKECGKYDKMLKLKISERRRD